MQLEDKKINVDEEKIQEAIALINEIFIINKINNNEGFCAIWNLMINQYHHQQKTYEEFRKFANEWTKLAKKRWDKEWDKEDENN